MSEEKSFLKHFLVIGSGTVVNMMVGFLTTPIITRIVGPYEYGQYSIFVLYASIALMVLCLGLDQALIRFFYRDDNDDYRRRILFECWAGPVIITVILGIALNVLCAMGVMTLECDRFIILMLTISVLFQILNRIDLILLRVTYQTKMYSSLQVGYKVSFAALSLVGCYLFKTNYLYVLVVATVLSYAMVVIVGIYKQKDLWSFWNIKKTYNIDRKELYTYAFPYILSMGITTFFQAIDKFSIKHFGTYSDVGIYSSAMTLVNVFVIVQSTFNAMWMPIATEHYEKFPEDKEYHKKGNRIITLIMFLMGLSLIFVKDVFVLLLGEEYREAAYILPFLIFNPIMLTISETTVVGVVFKKKSQMHIWIASVSCIVNLIGNTILVPIYGGRGAAISTGISYIVFFIMRTLISNKFYKIDWKLGRFWILTLLTAVYAWYCTFHQFDIVSIVGYFILLAVLLIMYKDVVIELYGIAKSIIKRKSK